MLWRIGWNARPNDLSLIMYLSRNGLRGKAKSQRFPAVIGSAGTMGKGRRPMDDASQGRYSVVDDEPGVRDIIKTYLEYGKMSVTTAGDGDEALHLAENKEFDVVLSDIMMPRMNGLTLASEIHRIQPDTMIILMTGYASVNTAVEAIKRDVFDYILKPFQNMQIVLQTVRRGVERKRLLTERKTLVEDLRRRTRNSRIIASCSWRR